MTMSHLYQLWKGVDSIVLHGTEPAMGVLGLTCDYKQCRPGFLYAAFTGETVDSDSYGEVLDGREFIEQAIQHGAVVILTDEAGWKRFLPVPNILYLVHPNPNETFAKMAANFFKQQPEQMVCVTGTNGKTSTVNFCRQLWHLLNKNSASIGNLGTLSGKGCLLWPAVEPFSVPETVALYDMLCKLAQSSVDYVAMEVTSHALFEYRTSGVRAKVAAFTSFSRDHLDFHGTMENYLQCKMRLLTEVLQAGGTAVLCADMSEFARIQQSCAEHQLRVISYGYQGKDIQLLHLSDTVANQHMVFQVQQKQYAVDISFPGAYQALNILCAISILFAQGFPIEEIIKQIPRLEIIPGRMQKVADYNGGYVFLDYAHTDDALRVILTDVRKWAVARVLLVFGAAGNRDQGKRELMGKIAGDYADIIIVTDDDPRMEDPAKIRQAIIKGCPQAYNIGHRKTAIEFAMDLLQPNDILIIAGKGGDDTQVIGKEKVVYSDAGVVQEKLGL